MASASRRNLFTTLLCLLQCTVHVKADWSPGGGPWGGGDDNDNTWGGHCGWNGDCSGNDGNDDGTNGSSQLPFSSTEIDHYTRVIRIHAVLACLVWVFLIPVGGILIRSGLKSPWIVRLHAILQSLSYLIYVAAAACGIYLVRSLSFGEYSMWEDPHTKIGIAILFLAVLQPILGIVHHFLYKRTAAAVKAGTSSLVPGRTIPGAIHVWLGRGLVVLGMINGGLGLRLAGQSQYSTNGQTKAIAYGVGAGIMFLLYVAFVVMGERRRSKEKQGHTGYDNNGNGVPLIAQREVHPPVYNHPPSYEASQDTLVKGGQTTARYA